jgi:3-methyladenine DNA glycosylase AlkD
MTQEEKQLLLKDLSARLPYGVFCTGTTYELDDDGEKYIPVKVKDTLTEIHNYKLETASVRLGLISSCKLETVKPYLRPMSSMTEEEKEELIKNFWGSDGIRDTIEEVDWYLSKHFDYRGLIEKGLAIEVTEENNPYEN